MSRNDIYRIENNIARQLCSIVVNFNDLERLLKQILSEYVQGPRKKFVSEILLHNSVLSFNAKLAILKYIVKKENLKFKDWEKLHKLINIRNAVAHSDNLLNNDGDVIGEEIVDEEYNLSIPIFEPYLNGPKITIFRDGKIDEKGLDTLHNDFLECYREIEYKLIDLKNQISNSANNVPQ